MSIQITAIRKEPKHRLPKLYLNVHQYPVLFKHYYFNHLPNPTFPSSITNVGKVPLTDRYYKYELICRYNEAGYPEVCEDHVDNIVDNIISPKSLT